MLPRDAEVDRVAERVIGCAIEVHRTVGPGLLESVYRECLQMELAMKELAFETERAIPVSYKGTALVARFRIDLLVERSLVIELKAVDAIRPVHKAQVITYLKLTGYPAGLLINFNEATLRAGLHRLDHPDRYVRLRARGDPDASS